LRYRILGTEQWERFFEVFGELDLGKDLPTSLDAFK